MIKKISELSYKYKQCICNRYKTDCSCCPLAIIVKTGDNKTLLSFCQRLEDDDMCMINKEYGDINIDERKIVNDIIEEIEQVLDNSVFDIMSLQDFIEKLSDKYG